MLQWTHGSLDLVGGQVNDIAELALRSLRPDDGDTFPPALSPFHVNLIHRDETRNLQNREQLTSLQADTQRLYSAGVGKKDGALFVVIIWAAGQQLRKQLGLRPKQFHITLSSPDTPYDDVDKDIDSLLPGQFPTDPSPDFLDHLIFTLHLSEKYQRAQKFCIDLFRALPDSHRGFLRLGDAALWSGQQKLAMMSYACAYQRTTEYKVQEYCSKKMVECSKKTEWGAVFLEQEIPQLSDEILQMLLTPWSTELRSHLSGKEIIPTLCLETRESLYIPFNSITGPFYRLPRFFRWLVPFHFAIMSTPRNEADIATLASPHLGIRHVLTLTEETPLKDTWFSGKAITNTYLPIPNFRPPSIEQMDIVMRILMDEEKLPLLVHCGGGKGK
jgi:atypical dual specificity phosphatase